MRSFRKALAIAHVFAAIAFSSACVAAPAEQPLIPRKIDHLINSANELTNSNPAKARALMEQAAATGNPEAINALADYVSSGIGGPADDSKARQLWEKAATAGSFTAQANLGRRLIESPDLTEQKRGFELLQRSHQHFRHVDLATAGLGVAYLLGRGTEQNLEQGVNFLEQADAIDRGDGQVEYLLARAFQSGWGGLQPNDAEALRHFEIAAEHQFPRAEWYLAMMYLNGRGTNKDEAQAYHWARKSALDGDRNGEISTAVMLALGQGVEKDPLEARAWYRKAAERGSAHALAALGGMLLSGEGGDVDSATGIAYLQLAAATGEDSAKILLSRVPAEAVTAQQPAVDKAKEAWASNNPLPIEQD